MLYWRPRPDPWSSTFRACWFDCSPWITVPSASASLGCEVVSCLVPGLTASDSPDSAFGELLRVLGLYVLTMSVFDNIDPAHLYPLTS